MQPWNFKKKYHIKGKITYSYQYDLFYINIDNLYKLIPTNIDKFPELKQEGMYIDTWGIVQGTFNPYITIDTRFVWGSLVELCDNSLQESSNECSSIGDSSESKCVSSTTESESSCGNINNIMESQYIKLNCTLNDILQTLM